MAACVESPTGDDRTAVLQAAVAATRRALDLHAAFATVPVDGGHQIAIRDGLHDRRWDEAIIRPGRGLGGRVLLEAQTVCLTDYLEDTTITDDYRPIVRSEGMHSIACLPLSVSGRVEALLYISHVDAGGVGDRLVEATRSIADLVSVTIGALQARAAFSGRARQALRAGTIEHLRDLAERIVADVPHATPALTARELEVLDLLAAGASNAQLARHLGIAESTAKEHVRTLRRKLGATSRLDAVARARAAGLV
jgi:DNA-binding CsgD family transcriptional regulator/transcriptional regulator with GAF, ATPase, and Fis domain